MAGDGRDGNCGLVDRLAKKVQKELGLLVLSAKQSTVDCLGLARQRLRAHLASTVSRHSEH